MTTPSFANREGKFWFDGGMENWQPQLNAYDIDKSRLVGQQRSAAKPVRLAQVRDEINQLAQWLHRVD